MADAKRAIPVWAWILAALILAGGVLLFFQWKDPMLLVFALALAGMLIAAFVVAALLRHDGDAASAPALRCLACGARNVQDAKFCSQCGKTM